MIDEKVLKLDASKFPENFNCFLGNSEFDKKTFAKTIKKSKRIVYEYADGFKYPSLETFVNIVNSLDVTMNDILS